MKIRFPKLSLALLIAVASATPGYATPVHDPIGSIIRHYQYTKKSQYDTTARVAQMAMAAARDALRPHHS